MDFAPGTSPEVYMSTAEIAEELTYQKVLLQSLETVQDSGETEAALKAEIASLERQLRRMKENEKRKNQATSSHHRESDFSSMRWSTKDDPFGPSLAVRDTKITKGNPSSTSSTPDSITSSKILLSPSRLNLPTRKRSFGEHLGVGYQIESDNKSRRTSPSPYPTRSTTPSTSSGYDYPIPQDEDGFFDLTAEDDSVSKELEQSLQRQKQAEEKAKREKADEEFARQLQYQDSAPLFFHGQSSQDGRTAFDRMLGRFNQPSRSSEPSQMNNDSFGVAVLSQPNTVTALGTELEHTDPSRPPMPGTFHDSESDSDIEFISSNDFRDNGRQFASRSAAQVTASPLFPFGQPVNPNLGSTYGIQPRSEHSYAGAAYPGYSAAVEAARQAAILRERGGLLEYRNNQLFSVSQPSFLPGGNMYPSATLGSNNFHGAAGPSNDLFMQMINRTTANGSNLMADDFGDPLDPRMSQMYDIYNDPRKTQQEIKELLENIRPDQDIPIENREGTPDGLKYPLYEHQKLALAWLKSMEEGSNKGGILADDMGLGKTISALALILSRPSADRNRKTTLIVGPVALVRQWEREIHTKIKRSHRLSTFLYHANKKAKWDHLKEHDIVLTTYGTLGAEYKRYLENEKKRAEIPNFDDKAAQIRLPFLGRNSRFYRVILDEAQCIKNKNTKAAMGALHLASITRICLTGTPMMNGVHELFSLIRFLRIKPYNDYSRFNEDFGCLTRGTGSVRTNNQAMKKLQAVLKAILLRRTKQSKVDGKPILTLPEKTEEIVHAVFNEDEDTYYRSLESKTRIQFNKYVKAGTIGKNYSNILVLLLRLRQAACHPHLIMDFDEAPPEATVEDMAKLAATLQPDVIGRIMAATVPFECPVCYDPVPNPRIVIPCGHDTCSECLVKIAANSADQNIAEGQEGSSSKCPTCRGLVDLKKIIDYETFKMVHMTHTEPTLEGNDSTQSEDDGEPIDEGGTDSASDSECDSDSNASVEDIRNFVVPDGYESSDEGDDEGDDDDLDIMAPMKSNPKDDNGKFKQQMKKEDSDYEKPDSFRRRNCRGKVKHEVKGEVKDEVKGEVKDEVKDEVEDEDKPFKEASISKKSHLRSKSSSKPRKSKCLRGKDKGKAKAKKAEPENKQHMSLAMLKKEAMKNAVGRQRYMRYLRKNWESSAKVDKCLELLRGTDDSVKTIVFSQFTTLLDLLEVPVRREKWGYERYDGSMSADARNDAVVTFTDDPTCRIMLVSLKAGNAGLNLTAASQVIIMDPFWNPFIEMQAVDRAHRIGQQKPVNVHRILVEKTVEDRIIELQNRKRKLVDAALDEKASRGLGRLGQAELVYLFGSHEDRETAARPVYAPAAAGYSSSSASSSPAP